MRRFRLGLSLAVSLLFAEAGAAYAGGWHAVAFMYHRFGEDRYPSTSVTLEQFEAHLDHLDEAGYEIWPLERILEHVRSGEPVPDRTVAITIDDAYASVYNEAYPRLKERGWPFTVFVATDPVDQGLSGFMRWEQMREMQDHGATFANHSATHDHLVRRRDGESEEAYRERLEADIRKARERLAEELDAERIPMLFAYPYGEYNRTVADVVAELGYIGIGQQSGAIGPDTDLLAVPRFPMAEAYAEIGEFRQKAGAKGLPVESLEPWDPVITGQNPPRMRVRLADSDARLEQLRCFVSRQGQVEVDWEDRDQRRFSVEPPASLGVGRTRYNCTAPSPESGRFYWFSQQWIRIPD